MKADIFQKALLATARVACCVSLLGACPRPQDPKGPADTTGQPQSQPASNVSKASLDECKAHVSEMLALPVTSSERKSEETRQCCDQIFTSARAATDEKVATELWAVQSNCCDLEWRSVGCFAWGPPCPPTMGALI